MVEPASVKFTVSAPSKVLLSGAYLIIAPENEGIVLSTTARFRTTVEVGFGGPEAASITVQSP